MSDGGARPVRVARRPQAPVRPGSRAPPRAVAPPTETIGTGSVLVRRPNRAATLRAIRLSVLFSAAIAALYGGLVALAETGPTAGSSGLDGSLELAGAAAALIAALGVLFSLGAAPRAVELGDDATVVVGRFGRRYVFPPWPELRTTVVQRVGAGLLASVPLESVEISGGSTRRTFLLDEHLLDPPEGSAADASRV